MHFFTAHKQQHLTLLSNLPMTQIHWRLFGVLTTIILASTGVLFGFFGADILQMILPVFEAETNMVFSLSNEYLPWIFIILAVLTICSEVLWIISMAWISGRVLRYIKTPLGFKHIFNMYMLIRVYEMAVGFAILLGMTIVSLYKGEAIPWLNGESSGVLSVFTSVIIPVGFFWLYLWSIKQVTHKKI